MMVRKNQHIELIVSRIEAETPGYWSVYFERPVDFVFEAGDWMDLRRDGQDLKGGITYSISSSPTEPEIRITFREGISEFKKALQTVKPGDHYVITQFGNDYDFQLKQNQSSVLIAGGVGIAPFRSMLKEMHDTHGKNEIRLIYLNQNETFLFKDELDLWAAPLPNVSMTYIPTKALNRKKRESLIRSLLKSTQHNFYISGPPGMVEANEHLLIDAGVCVRDIRIDSFGGY